MSTVLTAGAVVLCGHPSGVVTVTSSAVLTVGAAENPVLIETDLTTASVAGCLLGAGGAAGNASCTKILTVTEGRSSTLQVNGQPVLLDSLAGGTNGLSGGTPQQLLSGSDPTSMLVVTKGAP